MNGLVISEEYHPAFGKHFLIKTDDGVNGDAGDAAS